MDISPEDVWMCVRAGIVGLWLGCALGFITAGLPRLSLPARVEAAIRRIRKKGKAR